MSSRELFVLGTASQVPTRHRNHNGYFLRWDKEGILFDPGEGTQRQMILAGVSVSTLSRICITHFHGDHCLGLPGIIQRLSLDNVHQVTVHYPASGQIYFERLRKASIFAGLEKLDPRPIDKSGVIYEDDTVRLYAERLDHEVECFGYRLEEKEQVRLRQDLLDAAGLRGPRVGELLKKGTVTIDGRTISKEEVSESRPGQSFAFIMDTRLCSGARKLAANADLIVCESTFLSTEADVADISGHMTAYQAGQLAKDCNVRRLVVAHFSQRYESVDSFVQEAKQLHADVVPAQEPDGTEECLRHRISVPARLRVSG